MSENNELKIACANECLPGGPKSVGGARPGAGAPHGNANGQKHGLESLKRAWKELGMRAVDKRTRAGKAMKKYRLDLIRDLGGEDAISAQQWRLIDLVIRNTMILESIDAWLLTRDTLINKRQKALLPVVMQRQVLADGLARYLTALGLEKKVKPQTWKDILKQRQSQAEGLK